MKKLISTTLLTLVLTLTGIGGLTAQKSYASEWKYLSSVENQRFYDDDDDVRVSIEPGAMRIWSCSGYSCSSGFTMPAGSNKYRFRQIGYDGSTKNIVELPDNLAYNVYKLKAQWHSGSNYYFGGFLEYSSGNTAPTVTLSSPSNNTYYKN